MDNGNFKLIYSYPRKQTLDDGILIDVSAQAKESRFKVPVAVSANLYRGYVYHQKDSKGKGNPSKVGFTTSS
ncbi:MAG: hypothetical protein PWQ57_1293 [Desulfovibrionales bacterium]|nr:hypothetical protein [Desulfovibrionales bacterium]